MELEKTKNTINGMIAGIVNQIVNTLLPFALRTVMVYSLGIEYAGINSLFSSILSMLSMADLGFSGAVVFAMYKPVKMTPGNCVSFSDIIRRFILQSGPLSELPE